MSAPGPPPPPLRGTPSQSRREHQARSGRATRVAQLEQSWEFPGWGEDVHETLPVASPGHPALLAADPPRLGQLAATAICGNDILSSCLYVAGLVAASAGKLAPLVLAMVAAVLYAFRSIYGEAITTLPLNGGAYNVLLNATSKQVAAFAASLAILSYVATAVVSATSAAAYFAAVVPEAPVVQSATVLLLGFAALTALGLRDSAAVAVAIFVAHVLTLSALVALGAAFALWGPSELAANMAAPLPHVDVVDQRDSGSVVHALFFGFGAAMLGVSGFESSAQFVEEQAPGVFVKTLRNMWAGVAFFNPLLSLLSLAVLPLARVQHSPALMAEVADTAAAHFWGAAAGRAARTAVCVDAVVVLAGAVLTAYVGIVGLVRRMAADRCLPQLMLRTNQWRGTNHWIIGSFALVATTLLNALGGDVASLSGVYTFAFLGVMLCFSVGCMMLKVKRPGFRRTLVCPWSHAALGALAVALGLLANLLGRSEVVTWFVVYFGAVASVVFVTFHRAALMRLALLLVRHALGRRVPWVESALRTITSEPILFFAKSDDLCLLNKAVLYIRANEQTQRVVILHVHRAEEEPPPSLEEHVALIDALYPKVQVFFMAAQFDGGFGPDAVRAISARLGIPRNAMFIACPDDRFQFAIEKLGGLRTITA